MRGDDRGPTLARELMLRTVPLAIVAGSAWWFLDAPDWIWLLPLGAVALVLLGRGLRAAVPPPPEKPDSPQE